MMTLPCWKRILCMAVTVLVGWAGGPQVPRAGAVEPAELPAEALAPCEEIGRSAAVALNYCRASFHRIRKYPSKRVLLEEQEKILNNLNLNGIGDEEVVKLYTAVLAEISDVRIAEKEREFIQAKFRQTFERQLVTDGYKLATEIATQQYVAAVRTGAHSWWDFRTMGWHRDLDVWKVEKERLIAVVDKSSLFLDTFWKLTRKHPIPDRWLVRNDDLDRLEEAVREPDREVRLRILKRMEPFMECYPPYWYYVGRTQQGLGQLFAAAATYEKLVELGAGHFRKDEMLAAALANQAVIQEYLNQPSAAKTAREALRYSVDVWEVNLMAAHVLQRHGRTAEAEDALLRNLDTGLERDQSLACLLVVYARSQNRAKLLPYLADNETVRRLPAPVLLECMAAMGPEALTPAVLSHLGSSFYSYVDLKFGADDVVVAALPCWDLQHWQLALTIDGRRFAQPEPVAARGHHEFRFRGVAEFGTPLRPGVALPMTLSLAQGEAVALDLHLLHLPGQPPGAAAIADPFLLVAGDASREPQLPPRPGAWRIQAADVRGRRVNVGIAAALPAAPPAGAVSGVTPPAVTPTGVSTLPVSAPRTAPDVRTAPVQLGPIEVGTDAASTP